MKCGLLCGNVPGFFQIDESPCQALFHNGIGLDADISVLAQGDLAANLPQKHIFDTERRNAQRPVCSVQLVDEHIAKKRRRVLADGGVGRHQAQVRIHGVRFFVVVSRADLRQIAGFIVAAKGDKTDLAVALEAPQCGV